VQEAFVSFITHFDPDNGAPALAWLTLTLKRECWARSRRNQRQISDPTTADSQVSGDVRTAEPRRGPEEVVELIDSFSVARERLQQLKPNQRKALGLFALGYSYREIAELTGWTYTKVNRSITEGRAALRDGIQT
jgi:RNA polymerase sigma factor (sigma-70 family)